MEQQLTCAMDIGEQMLISGAEVHRVEESLQRICKAFGATRTDVFIITSSMVVTIFDEENRPYTQTRRITGSTIDIEKIHRLNDLSRRICAQKMTLEQVRAALNEALCHKTYPFWVELLCYAGIAGAFTLFFGGSLTEAIVSLAAGAIVRCGIWLCDRALTNKILSKFLSAVVATFLAYLSVRLGWVGSVDKIIIGNIMTLIPGIGLTNALRDLFTGDSIAGLLRTIEAVLIALAIAAGYFLVAFLGGLLL